MKMVHQAKNTAEKNASHFHQINDKDLARLVTPTRL